MGSCIAGYGRYAGEGATRGADTIAGAAQGSAGDATDATDVRPFAPRARRVRTA